MHLLSEPVDLPPGVAEDDGLSNGDGLVKIAQGVEFPLFLLNSDVELLDTLKSQFIPLDEDSDRVAHELFGDLQNVSGHGGGKENDLGVLREELEDYIHRLVPKRDQEANKPTFVNLVLEPTRQHFISLIQTEDLDVVGPQCTTVDHVKYTAWCTNDDLDTLLELGHILTDIGATNTGMAFDVHIVSESDDDLLDLLGQLAGRCENESLGALDGHVQLSSESTKANRRDEGQERLVTCWRIEIEKVAVLPVPDWACAMTSWPFTTGTIARCWMADGRSKLKL